MTTALEITDLSTEIKLSRSTVYPVGNVGFKIDQGETLGLVGESGSGKSMLGLSILGLLPNGGHITGGSIKLGDRELVGMAERDLRELRGNEVAMIFQDSLSSLNPTKTIGEQVAEPGATAPRRQSYRGDESCPGGVGSGRTAASEGTTRRLSPPAVRRSAAARA